MIKHFSTFNSITVYWDLDEFSNFESYYIYADGKLYQKSQKTHFTLRDLNPQTTYLIEIYGEGKTTPLYSENIVTPPSPVFINVAEEPYNAAGDGITLNTAAIQAAIDACGIGECVYIPKGVFLSGALTLHSDMQLYIEEGAALLGSENPDDYLPKIKSRFEGTECECYRSLINIGSIDDRKSIHCSNVLLYGGGTICGGGLNLAKSTLETERKRLIEYIESLGEEIKTYENADTIPGRARGRLINISQSQYITIDNLSLKNGPSWNVHMIYSDNIVTSNCYFYSHGIWNGDGWDPDSSTNCAIFGCKFDTGDDCIAIKSGKNPEGNIIAKPCSNILIFDCNCTYAHSIAIGSEMSGGIENIKIWDCNIENSIFGIEIKATKKRGGYVRNVTVKRSRVPRLLIHSVDYNDDGAAAPTIPDIYDCVFENIHITQRAIKYKSNEKQICNPIEIVGFNDENKPVKNIVFKDIVIEG